MIGGTTRAALVYTVARFGLFLGLWVVLLAFGVGGVLGALIAAIVSLPLSWFLLAPQRNRLANRIAASRGERLVIDPEHRPES